MRKRIVAGVGVIAIVFGVIGTAHAALITRPRAVQTNSGIAWDCPAPLSLHWWFGWPVCY